MNPNRKTVYQYTLDGKFVSEYPHLEMAAKSVNGDISAISLCCNGKAKTAYGFLWSRTQSPDHISTMVANAQPKDVESLDGELWVDIKGYEGLYQISNRGRVKSVARMIISDTKGMCPVDSKILGLRRHNKGYYTLSLWHGDIREQKYVHRLVAEHFIDNPNKYPCVNHIDNNPSNNNVENLEWCTHKMNTAHARRQKRLLTFPEMGCKPHTQPYRVCLTDGTHVGDFPRFSEAMIAIGENPNNYAPINNMRQGKPYKGKYIFSKIS